jgi:hypothetical protein
MVDSLSFELRVLERMSEAYAADLLEEIGLTKAKAAEIRAQCPLSLPEQLDSDLDTYSGLLGPAVKSESLGNDVPAVFSGSVANNFLLTLWPHLYWTVNTRPDGRSWGVGFRNQVALDFEQIDASMIRRGVWTRSALEELADQHELYDGWDERVLVRFSFGVRVYAGTFVFGLLQDWKRL